MQDRPDDLEGVRASAMAEHLRVVIGKLNRRLRGEANTGDFTSSQKAVILMLERVGPSTVTALAQAEGVRPQSMGATVAALEAGGLVAGETDPADRRRILLSLTPACTDMLQAGRAARRDWLFRALQSRLTAEEREDLGGALRLLERLVE